MTAALKAARAQERTDFGAALRAYERVFGSADRKAAGEASRRLWELYRDGAQGLAQDIDKAQYWYVQARILGVRNLPAWTPPSRPPAMPPAPLPPRRGARGLAPPPERPASPPGRASAPPPPPAPSSTAPPPPTAAADLQVKVPPSPERTADEWLAQAHDL